MKIKQNTFWEKRAYEIASQIKYLELAGTKLLFKKTTHDIEKYGPKYVALDWQDRGANSTGQSRHIEVIQFDYSDDRTIQYLLDLNILDKEKTESHGKINYATSLVKGPVNSIPATYSSYANREVIKGLAVSNKKNSDSVASLRSISDGIKLIYEPQKLSLRVFDRIYPISSTKLDGDADLILDYLTKHPNEIVPLNTLKIEIKRPKLHRIVKTLNNQKIKGNLYKAFFSSQKNAIRLINPISIDRLNNLGISIEELIAATK